MAKTSEFFHIDTKTISVSFSSIVSQPHSLFHKERAVTKSDPIFGKNPLDIFEPIWDGTAFLIDPYVAKAIRDRLSKGLEQLTDCGNQFPKSSLGGLPRENQSLVESARYFLLCQNLVDYRAQLMHRY